MRKGGSEGGGGGGGGGGGEPRQDFKVSLERAREGRKRSRGKRFLQKLDPDKEGRGIAKIAQEDVQLHVNLFEINPRGQKDPPLWGKTGAQKFLVMFEIRRIEAWRRWRSMGTWP